MNNNHLPRIEICGGIASGKTTLAKLLGGKGFRAVTENFESNPFLNAFYQNQQDNAFETEVVFSLLHFSDIKRNTFAGKASVCDFAIVLDLAYAYVTLNVSERKAFISVNDEIISKVGYPLLTIYLKCSPEILLQRIINRNRDMEKRISIDYLNKLNDSIEERLNEARRNTDILVIDSGKYDFTGKDDTYIIKIIMDKWRSLRN